MAISFKRKLIEMDDEGHDTTEINVLVATSGRSIRHMQEMSVEEATNEYQRIVRKMEDLAEAEI